MPVFLAPAQSGGLVRGCCGLVRGWLAAVLGAAGCLRHAGA